MAYKNWADSQRRFAEHTHGLISQEQVSQSKRGFFEAFGTGA